jgi:hypothetical protein
MTLHCADTTKKQPKVDLKQLLLATERMVENNETTTHALVENLFIYYQARLSRQKEPKWDDMFGCNIEGDKFAKALSTFIVQEVALVEGEGLE